VSNITTSLLLAINALMSQSQTVQIILLGAATMVDVFSTLLYWTISPVYRNNYVPFNVSLIIER